VGANGAFYPSIACSFPYNRESLHPGEGTAFLAKEHIASSGRPRPVSFLTQGEVLPQGCFYATAVGYPPQFLAFAPDAEHFLLRYDILQLESTSFTDPQAGAIKEF